MGALYSVWIWLDGRQVSGPKLYSNVNDPMLTTSRAYSLWLQVRRFDSRPKRVERRRTAELTPLRAGSGPNPNPLVYGIRHL